MMLGMADINVAMEKLRKEVNAILVVKDTMMVLFAYMIVVNGIGIIDMMST